MHIDDAPELHQNPYHPYEQTARYQAFRDGWRARCDLRPRTANPHDLSRTDRALAWLDGWTAAREQEQNPEADPWRTVIGRRSGTESDRGAVHSTATRTCAT
jgi:ribosome modulation factor